METTDKQPRPNLDSLLCVCGNEVKANGVPLRYLASQRGWDYYPHSPHADGTNALCRGCQTDGEDDE